MSNMYLWWCSRAAGFYMSRQPLWKCNAMVTKTPVTTVPSSWVPGPMMVAKWPWSPTVRTPTGWTCLPSSLIHAGMWRPPLLHVMCISIIAARSRIMTGRWTSPSLTCKPRRDGKGEKTFNLKLTLMNLTTRITDCTWTKWKACFYVFCFIE